MVIGPELETRKNNETAHYWLNADSGPIRARFSTLQNQKGVLINEPSSFSGTAQKREIIGHLECESLKSNPVK